jgi:fused signal recognition particle receptor
MGGFRKNDVVFIDDLFTGEKLMSSSLILFSIFALSIFIFVVVLFYIRKKKGLEEKVKKIEIEHAPKESREDSISQVPLPLPEITWKDRLMKGLNTSHQQLWGRLGSLVGKKQDLLTEEEREELEALLYKTDMGPKIVQELLHYMDQQKLDQSNIESGHVNPMMGRHVLYDFLEKKLNPIVNPKEKKEEGQMSPGPRVVMIVGVNGVGKTTTIGKLATKWRQEGLKVVVGACDTFRAAAVEQLSVWCDRADVPIVKAKEGSDPSGAVFETCQKAKDLQADICLIDTAGRLQNNGPLMEELKKGKRVAQKVIPGAPHDIYLVLDAITGQHALKQAMEFHQHLQLTGLIYTKCDGSSKAGSAIGIMEELKIPIKYIGVGEQVEDLNMFSLKDYLEALLAMRV